MKKMCEGKRAIGCWMLLIVRRRFGPDLQYDEIWLVESPDDSAFPQNLSLLCTL